MDDGLSACTSGLMEMIASGTTCIADRHYTGIIAQGGSQLASRPLSFGGFFFVTIFPRACSTAPTNRPGRSVAS